MKRLAFTFAVVLAVGAFTSAASATTAVPTFTFFFPPIADCGTVGVVTSFYDFDGDGELDECLVWLADSGGAYLVAGLEAYDVGDRVFVKGTVCTTCLTTCPAAPIFSPVLSDCPPKKGKK